MKAIKIHENLIQAEESQAQYSRPLPKKLGKLGQNRWKENGEKTLVIYGTLKSPTLESLQSGSLASIKDRFSSAQNVTNTEKSEIPIIGKLSEIRNAYEENATKSTKIGKWLIKMY